MDFPCLGANKFDIEQPIEFRFSVPEQATLLDHVTFITKEGLKKPYHQVHTDNFGLSFGPLTKTNCMILRNL